MFMDAAREYSIWKPGNAGKGRVRVSELHVCVHVFAGELWFVLALVLFLRYIYPPGFFDRVSYRLGTFQVR